MTFTLDAAGSAGRCMRPLRIAREGGDLGGVEANGVVSQWASLGISRQIDQEASTGTLTRVC